MLTRIIWFTIGLALIMTALLGNLGALIGAIIDPADMVLGNRELAGIPGSPASGTTKINCDEFCSGIVDTVARDTCIKACQLAEQVAGQ